MLKLSTHLLDVDFSDSIEEFLELQFIVCILGALLLFEPAVQLALDGSSLKLVSAHRWILSLEWSMGVLDRFLMLLRPDVFHSSAAESDPRCKICLLFLGMGGCWGGNDVVIWSCFSCSSFWASW